MFLFFLFTFANAQTIDKVIAHVNNYPITTYDIYKATKEYKITPKDALNLLIDNALLNLELEKRGIEVDEFELQEAMEKIAKQNGFNLFEFKNILAQKGELNKFKNELKKRLKKEKLFNEIVKSNLKISEDEIKNYYKTHQKNFEVFDTIQVVEYSANNPNLLKEIKKNPLLKNPNIKVKTILFSYNQLPMNLLFLFNKTKTSDFTPIINSGSEYKMFYVVRKDGKKLLPYEKVKNLIANKLMQQKKEEILKEYFTKLKNKSEIEIFN